MTLKQILALIGLSIFSLAAGFTIRSSGQISAPNPTGSTNPIQSATPCEDQFPKLIEDSYVTKFNGPRLTLKYESGVPLDEIPYSIDGAKVTQLASGDLLVNVGDTLYRLDNHQRIVWTYRERQLIVNYASVETTNLIYGTAFDNVMFILDATTGKLKFRDSRNGSAAYGVAEKYGDDMCLVTDYFVMYREKFRGTKIEPMKDGITCWRGTKILWHLDFPPDAELVVNGKRILAVTKSRKAIYINEIMPPQIKSG